MGRISQKKNALAKKKAKARKILSMTEEVVQAPVSPRGLMNEAIQYFQSGDEQNAKKLAKRVIKVIFRKIYPMKVIAGPQPGTYLSI